MKFTILGSNGFIGSHIVKHLKKNGISCYSPDLKKEQISSKNLGHVIYAIGVSDFKNKPFEVIDSHVCLLKNILEKTNFDSFLYLSSTRVYYNSSTIQEEDSLVVNPQSLSDLYNISKLMGESLCFASKKPNVRVVRLSNVTGNSNAKNLLFIPWIMKDAIEKKKITLFSSLESEKDYVYIDDVVKILPEISLKGKFSIYNVATGKNIKSRDIVNELVKITGCDVEVAPDAKTYSFPPISIKRIKNEFNFEPISILSKIKEMVDSYNNNDEY